jgi:hypothetical protein
MSSSSPSSDQRASPSIERNATNTLYVSFGSPTSQLQWYSDEVCTPQSAIRYESYSGGESASPAAPAAGIAPW